jgi:hypothetical protein
MQFLFSQQGVGQTMLRRIILVLAFLLLPLFAGCATYSWHHPYKGQNEFNQDKYTCIQQSAQSFPVVIQQQSYGTGHTSPSETQCNANDFGQMNCTTTPGTYNPPLTNSFDINEGNRKGAFNSCMTANGWYIKQNPSEPPIRAPLDHSTSSSAKSDLEGDSCVIPGLKVGDVVRKTNGRKGVIKSLSGTSPLCVQPEFPIRAHLDYSTNSSFTSKAVIDLSNEWKPTPLTEQQKLNGGVLMASNKAINASLYISTSQRIIVTDIMSIASSIRAVQASSLDKPQQSDIERITVNGMRACRYEITGNVKRLFGKKYTYVTTILEGGEEIIRVTAWTSADSFDKKKVELKDLSNKISGINNAAEPVVAAPSPAKVFQLSNNKSSLKIKDDSFLSNQVKQESPDPSISAQQLRELKKLKDEGILTEDEYQKKKKSVLDRM